MIGYSFELSIITCPATIERVPGLISSWRNILNMSSCVKTNISVGKDKDCIDLSVFRPDKWSDCIDKIADILIENIYCVQNKPLHSRGNATARNSLLSYFQPRQLSLQEKSLAWAHYILLSSARKHMMLVLEDDAVPVESEICNINHYLEACSDLSIPFDLCYYPGLEPSRLHYIKHSKKELYTVFPLARTRTTCGFIMPALIASKLAEEFWPCSLPVDLHLQYLYFKLGIPGAWTNMSCVINGSLQGQLASSIQ